MKQNYQVKIEVMEKEYEKLQSCHDIITKEHDKAKENIATISHNAQRNKKNYELCIESLKNELCTKANDLSISLEERDNLLEEISNKNQIVYNLKSKLQHEHEKIQQLEERNLKCKVEKEAAFKQLHEDMIFENLEYKDSNEKLKIEITKLIEQNNVLILQVHEEKSRFKILEAEAIANKALSKEIEENLQLRNFKYKTIFHLARQRGKDFMLKKNYLQVQNDKMFNKMYILKNQITIMSCVGIAFWYFHAIYITKYDKIITKVLPMNEKIIYSIAKCEIKSLIKNDTVVNCQEDQLVTYKTQMIFDLKIFLSKHVVKQSKLTINIFPRIYCLQESEALWKSKLKSIFYVQPNKGWLMKYFEVKCKKLKAFSTWKQNYLSILNSKIRIMNLVEVNKHEPKLLKRNVLQKKMDFRMWDEKNSAKQKLKLRNEIFIFISKSFHLDLEYVKKIICYMTFAINIYKVFMKNSFRIKILQVSHNLKIWNPGIF